MRRSPEILGTQFAGSLRSLVARGAAWGIVSRLVIAACNLAMSALLLRSLGTHDYGALAVILSAIGLIPFADLGIGAAILSPVAAAYASGQQDRIRGLIAAGRKAVAVPAVGLMMLGVLTASSACLIRGTAVDLSALGALLIVLGSNLPFSIYQRALAGIQRTDRLAQFNIVGVLIALVATATALTLTHRLWVLVVADALQFVTTSLLSVAAVRRTVGRGTIVAADSHSLRKFGAIFFAIMLAGALSYETDELIIAIIKGPATVTIYDAHARPFAFIFALSFASVTPFWAGLAAAAVSHDGQWIARVVGRLALAAATLSLLAGLLVLWALPPYLSLMSGGRVHEDRVLAWALVGWAATMGAAGAVGVACNGLNLMSLQLRVAVAMTVGNLAIGIPLTQPLGAAGPILGTLSSQAVAVAVLLFAIRRVAMNGSSIAPGIP